MQVEGHKSSRNPAVRWDEFLRKTALALGSVLLASAAVCWVAANWPHASAFQKLTGIQLLLAALIVTSWRLVYVQRPLRDHNASLAAHIVGLAAVVAGALLALVGQIYQTGADSWQLFILWLLLIVPWVLAMHTVFLGLLGVLLLNAGAGLYLNPEGSAAWLLAGTAWLGAGLLLAVLNAGLLVLWEIGIGLLHDRWRAGPRLLATALIGWLWVAALAGIDAPGGAVGAALPGLMLMALMHRLYSSGGRRRDPAMVALALLGALVLLAIPLIAWVDGELSLLLTVVVLTIAAGLGVRSLGGLLPERASPWFVSLFRIAAMGLTAGLLIVLLAMLFEPEMDALWAWGLLLAGFGILVVRARKSALLREGGMTLAAAGLFLVCAAVVQVLDQESSLLQVAGLLGFGVVLYLLVDNTAMRLLAAFCVLAVASFATWPPDGYDGILDLGNGQDLRHALPIYLRMWWLMAGAVLALVVSHRRKDRMFWLPLGWALVALAQLLGLMAPAPTFYGAVHGQGYTAGLFIIWAACALLPAIALAALLWRSQVPEASLRLSAPAALAAASLGWMGAPGIALALLWVLLGHALQRRSLLGFGVMALLVYLAHFYYQLDSTLLQKSAVLGMTGAWLLMCWYLLDRYCPRGPLTTERGPADPTDGVGALLAPAWSPVRRRAQRMARLALLPTGLVLILAFANTRIYHAEQLIAQGQRVVLALAPVDPRSLMQGDYMALRFAVADQLHAKLREAPPSLTARIEKQQGGYLVLKAGDDGVFSLVSVLAQAERVGDVSERPKTVLLAFESRAGSVRIVTDAWFFPEGQASRYAQARYGEFRVGENGRGLLVGLLDEAMKPLP